MGKNKSKKQRDKERKRKEQNLTEQNDMQNEEMCSECPITSVVVIEVQAGEGNGLTNKMKNHLFNTKEEALKYIATEFQCNQTKPVKQMDFLTDLLKFKHAELFVSPSCAEYQSNDLLSSIRALRGDVNNPIPKNAMAIYLACSLMTGISVILSTRGPAFFIGRNERNECVTANVLWGVANFIWDAVYYYGVDEFIEQGYDGIRPVFEKWAQEYISQTWKPWRTKLGGANIYQTDVTKLDDVSKSFWDTIDHRN